MGREKALCPKTIRGTWQSLQFSASVLMMNRPCRNFQVFITLPFIPRSPIRPFVSFSSTPTRPFPGHAHAQSWFILRRVRRGIRPPLSPPLHPMRYVVACIAAALFSHFFSCFLRSFFRPQAMFYVATVAHPSWKRPALVFPRCVHSVAQTSQATPFA